MILAREADPNDAEDAALEQTGGQGLTALPGAASLFNERKSPIQNDFPNTVQASGLEAKAVLEAFASDTGPAAEAVQRLLKSPTPETARQVLNELPALLPDDPALAAVIAEAMAKEFGTSLANERTALANSGHPYTKCPGCGKFMSPNGSCQHCGFAALRKRADGTGWTVTSHYKSGEECIRYENRASELARSSK